ncbi:MAG: bile acid:sodium symporter, partial [Pseudomonadota bacterium]
GGAVSNYFSALAEANVALSVGLSAVSSLAAFAMTPFTISFWGHRLPATQALLRTVDVNFWQMFALVLLVLIMPTVLGILFARHRPVLADRIRRPFRLLSGSVFVLFIAGAFLANTSLFLTFFDRIAALVVVHNAVALLVGFVLAKLAHVGLPERKTITIETGIQNTALGLVLVFSFFEGLGGMALIAGFWGIWHLIAGGLLAIFFNQRGSYKTA